MSLISNLKSDNLEKEQDTVGGSYILESNIYTGNIKYAYLHQSKGGATGCTLAVDINGQEYTETLWLTNKEGKNFYVGKDKKQHGLPGYTLMNDISLIAAHKPLSGLDDTVQDKILEVYDFEAKARIKKSLPCITGLQGLPIALAIQKQIVDKNVSDGNGGYVPSGETRETNTILKAMHPEKKLTVAEATDKKEAIFWDTWLKKNQGVTKDRSTKTSNSTLPFASAATNAAPAADPFA